MFKPGDEKYKKLSLLFNCLNGILFTVKSPKFGSAPKFGFFTNII